MIMGSRRDSSLCVRWLGQALRQMREQRKLTLKDASAHLLRDPGSISRFENGRLAPKPADVGALMNLYGVEDSATRMAFDLLCRDAWGKAWWDVYAGTVGPEVVDYVWLENRSESIHTYDVSMIPALLQTRDYAETLIRTADPGAADVQVRSRLDLHALRQRILTRRELVRLSVIVDEAALRRRVGGAPVIARQLAHLIDQAEQPNITVRVLPLHTGAHAGTGVAPFRLHQTTTPVPQAACVDGPAGPLVLPTDGRLPGTYARLWERLSRAALNAEESAEIITAAEKDFRA